MLVQHLITLNNVTKSFFSDHGQVDVLKNITFHVNEGEIVALIGPSGCGKSTILNLISSLESPSVGQIEKNCVLGYMFQKDNLMPWRNVFDNIKIGLELKKSITKENIKYLNNLLDKYGLSEFKDYYPNELSGGMRQRVALIRTLALNPDLLLLDEPFSALDSQTRLYVQNDVHDIIHKEKKAALIVTHDISEAVALADRIILLSARPCSVKQEFVLDFPPNSNPLTRRESEKFSLYFNLVYKELNNHEKDQ